MKSVRFVIGALAAFIVGCGGTQDLTGPVPDPASGLSVDEVGQLDQNLTPDDCTCSPMAKSFGVSMANLPGCSDAVTSWSRACVASTHNFCRGQGFSGGYPAEAGNGGIQVDCYKAAYGDIALGTLQAYNASCSLSGLSGTSFSKFCISAADVYCRTAGYSSGTLQVYNGNGTAKLSCIYRPSGYDFHGSVPVSTLAAYNPGCSLAGMGNTTGFGTQCDSAANRYCEATGAVGGYVVQGSGPSSVAVACYRQ